MSYLNITDASDVSDDAVREELSICLGIANTHKTNVINVILMRGVLELNRVKDQLCEHKESMEMLRQSLDAITRSIERHTNVTSD